MTIRECYEFALIECNKLKAPSMLLEDYIYLFNKAIQQYINLVYNRCEYNQQSSDDLAFLQTKVTLTNGELNEGFDGKIWKFKLPSNYLHIMNCKAKFTGSDKQKGRCDNDSISTKSVQCHRLTADIDSGILNNYYMKPSHKRPYFYIINREEHSQDDKIKNNDVGYNPVKVGDGFRYIDLKEQYDRTSNQSIVYIEIYAGDTSWDLNGIEVTYLKSPMYVSMTHEQLYSEADTTQVLEFPDYVCYEIINLYIRLLLENASDPRIQTHPALNQTIAVPGEK